MTPQPIPATVADALVAKPGAISVQYGEVRDIPLNRLKASPKNVRRVGHSAEVIAARAASIRHKGVLQPLVVEPEIKAGRETGYYLVSAGEGLRQALRLLAKRKALATGALVRCVVDTVNDPSEVSMDENLSREPIIAVQIFVVLIEFKLVTLAGFVLVPFGLFGRTAFLAEKVLGAVIASGVKVMVLAIIVGIGASLFSEFNSASEGQPTLEEVLAMALAALTLLGLSIFGPGVAAGLVSGAPQLGAGAAVGTGVLVGGMAMAGAAGAQMVASGIASGVAGGGAGGGAGAAAAAGGGRSPPTDAGPSGDLAPRSPPGGGGVGAERASASASSSREPGERAGKGAAEGSAPASQTDEASAPPAWARDLQRRQALTHGAAVAVHALGAGDSPGAGPAPNLSEDKS